MKKIILTFVLIFSAKAISQQGAIKEMHITEQLLYASIKIDVLDKNNKSYSGTGFFFNLFDDKQNRVPIIVTNRHVVDSSKTIRLYFNKGKNGAPDLGPALVVDIPNDSKTVIGHPDKNVDLVAIPIAFIDREFDNRKIDTFRISLDENLIVEDSIQKKELKAIEDVWMIGYPNGLWDSANNLPIVRKGTTATSPYINYGGKREFLIDMAAFGGSSGSPIYYYRDVYTDKKTYKAMVGPKLYLLGVLYAGPLYTVEGTVVKTSPQDDVSKVRTGIPMNLGYVIKASEILGFKKVLIP